MQEDKDENKSLFPWIHILSEDDLVLVFSYLDYDDLESAFFTCQRFREVVEEYFFSR